MTGDTWEDLFRRWVDRLLESGWDLNFVADRSYVDAYADVETIPANRRATIRYNPEHLPRNSTACHEICHILVSHLVLAVDNVVAALDEPARNIAKPRLIHEEEETVEAMERAFLKAYEEL